MRLPLANCRLLEVTRPAEAPADDWSPTAAGTGSQVFAGAADAMLTERLRRAATSNGLDMFRETELLIPAATGAQAGDDCRLAMPDGTERTVRLADVLQDNSGVHPWAVLRCVAQRA